MSVPKNSFATIANLTQMLVEQLEMLFESISVSKIQPIASFPPQESSNYLYVLYASTGMPVKSGVITDDIGKRDLSRLQKDVQTTASLGFLTSYRIVEFGSAKLASRVGEWIDGLFGSVVGSNSMSAEQPVRVIATAPSLGQKKRGRPKGSKNLKPSKSGSTKKVDAATGEVRKGPGRPKKVNAATGEVRKGPGRPRKVDATNSASAPKKRGPKPKAARG